MISNRTKDKGVPRIGAGVLALGLAALIVHNATGLGGAALESASGWLYDALLAGAGLACVARAIRYEEERAAWATMGAGLLVWTAGEIYYTLAFGDASDVPIPSPADIGYLAFYPASYLALVLLVRARVPNVPRTLWLDGSIAAAAVTALAASLALEPIAKASLGGSTAQLATNLAYPIGDLLLLALVVAVFGLLGWRPGRGWLLLGLGLGVMAVADVVYLFQSARGTYTAGGMLDVWWPAAALLVGLAAWAPARSPGRARLEGLRSVLFPTLAAVVAVGIETYDHFDRLTDVAVVLASLTLLAVAVRMALSFRANQAMLGESRREALTDALTGLGNRRSLLIDLEQLLARPPSPRGDDVAVMFDLDGFKSYNDSYGHPAGDELLRRLGTQLASAVAPYGAAYRLGGDEFCVLAHPGRTGIEAVAGAAAAALTESGEGFTVGVSYGAVSVPSEATTVSQALLFADRRMYAQKASGRASAASQSRDVLITTLRERQPALHEHVADVAELAVTVGREMEMPGEELDELRRAAELHDVGKMAIPDAILDKPGPLDEAEWDFMRRHTVIGERIVAAAPALAPVAALVRSSHERWDGAGYPDGLEGEQIPLGSRIVAACDAFDAMVTERPYRSAMAHSDAVTELERCAGSQFDPGVVEAMKQVFTLRLVSTPNE